MQGNLRGFKSSTRWCGLPVRRLPVQPEGPEPWPRTGTQACTPLLADSNTVTPSYPVTPVTVNLKMTRAPSRAYAIQLENLFWSIMTRMWRFKTNKNTVSFLLRSLHKLEGPQLGLRALAMQRHFRQNLNLERNLLVFCMSTGSPFTAGAIFWI